MKVIKTFFLFFLITCSIIPAKEKVRITTYNLLNYPEALGFSRSQKMKIIFEAIKTDILVCQEMATSGGVTQFISQVLGPKYVASPVKIAFENDNTLFYKDSLFTILNTKHIPTDLRDITEYTLVHNFTGDSLIIYSMHLKASSGSDNENKRFLEVQKLREVTDLLPKNKNYIAVGDMNIYKVSEKAFQAFLNQETPGYFLDPINSPNVTWNNAAYSYMHTQSTRTTQLSDGGASGGLDDRFDLMLISPAVKDSGGVTYIHGSLTPFGNDGKHYNKAINESPNDSVSAEVAEALYAASDHLPVYADYWFESVSTSVNSEITSPSDYKLSQNYPNPFNPSTTIEYSVPASEKTSQDGVNVTLIVYDMLGRTISNLVDEYQTPGSYKITFNASSLSSGIYFYKFSAGHFTAVKKLTVLK